MTATLPRVRSRSSLPHSSRRALILAIAAFVAAGCATNKPTLTAPTYTPEPDISYADKNYARESERSAYTGEKYMPVKGVTQKQIANNFGAPRDGGARTHKGIDIFAPSGRELLAMTSGYVHRTYNNLGGNAVYLRGDDGRSYYYAHLLKYHANANTGDRVQAGQVIGYVGNSGNAKNTPAHLHFEIKEDGQTINPYYALRSPDLVVVPVSSESPVEYAENGQPPRHSPGGVTAPVRATPAKNSGGIARRSTGAASSATKARASKSSVKKSSKATTKKFAAKKTKSKKNVAVKKSQGKKKQMAKKVTKASKKKYAAKKGSRGYGKRG